MINGICKSIYKALGGRIGAKILFWFLFLNTIAGLTMIYFIHDFMSKRIISEHLADMARKRELAAHQIKFGIREHLATASTVSKAPLVRIFLKGDDSLSLPLNGYISAIKHIHSSSGGHNTNSIELTDSSGLAVLSTSEERLGKDLSESAPVKAALSGESGFAGPFLNEDSVPGKSVFAFAPVYDEETIIGAVVVEEDIKYYSGLLTMEEFRPGRTEETYIVGTAGSVGPDAVADAHRMEFLSSPRFYSGQGDASSPSISAAAKGRTGHMTTVNYNGDEVISAYAPIEGANWAVITEMGRSEALESLNALKLRLILMGMAVVSAIGIVSVSIARSITLPILNLHRATKEIGEGNLDTKIIVPTGDEIESLADEFNLMRRKLKDSYASLEDKVRARTGQLLSANRALEAEISVRKLSEEKLATAMNELDAILESAQIGISYLKHRRIVRINRKLEEMLGIKREAVIGMTTEMFYTDRAAYENLGAEAYPALSEGRIYNTETRLKRRDGSVFWAGISGKAVSAGNADAGSIWIIEDLTGKKEAEGKILSSLREKETLLMEIHHRVKNNLQIISSLLNLQSRALGDGRLREAFEDSKNRVRSMALIHEKLYDSNDLARIDFASYAETLVARLARSYNTGGINISVKTDVSVKGLDLNDALPCGLIINELVSNSLKYAFAGRADGEILIGLNAHKNDEYELSVRDNGPGIPEGVRPDDSETLGLRLVRALVDQIEGAMEYSGICGAGFTVRFRPSHLRSARNNA